jgi:hypothetical protein
MRSLDSLASSTFSIDSRPVLQDQRYAIGFGSRKGEKSGADELTAVFCAPHSLSAQITTMH